MAVPLREIERLYDAHYTRFLRLALSMVGSREAARDAVQETFARAVRERGTIRRSASLEAWIWRTLTNVCRDQEQERRHFSHAAEGVEHASEDGSTESPELRAALALLPERQRLAVFLRHYADLDYARIADVMGVAEGTVAATLHSAYQHLRGTLTEVTR